MARTKQTAFKGTGAKILKSAQNLKPAPATGIKKRPHRYRPGTVALREMRKYRKGTDLFIRKAAFHRLVKELTVDELARDGHSIDNLRWTDNALVALQEASEAYIVHVFGDAQLCAMHAKRVTVMPSDLKLARRIAGGRQ